MTATAGRYRPNDYSERLLAVLPSQPPYLGCGISTILHGIDMSTLGEFSTTPAGRLKNKRQRTADMVRGWRTFKRVPDSNGIPDTDDYERIHRAVAPSLPLPDKLWTRNRSDVIDQLKAGMAVSIAVRLRIFGATNPIDFTTADHQVLIWGTPVDGEVNVMGPMRPYSTTYHGHRAPLHLVFRAAEAINGGLILTWLTPIGGWTQASLGADKLADRIATLRSDRNAAERIADNRQARLVALRAELAVIKETQPSDCDPLIDNAHAAAHESAHVQSIEWHEEQRMRGPADV